MHFRIDGSSLSGSTPGPKDIPMLLVLNRPDKNPLNVDPLTGADDYIERPERLGFATALVDVCSRQDHDPSLVEPGSEQL